MNIGSEESKAYLILGVFRDKCVKLDGLWLFDEEQADIQQSALWTEGWEKKPPVTGFFKIEWCNTNYPYVTCSLALKYFAQAAAHSEAFNISILHLVCA